MELQVGVKVLLRNPEGKYLLMRRAPDPEQKKQLKWDIPGGRIDIGSELLKNLAREVMEETGLTMTSNPRLLAAQDLMPDLKPIHVVRLTYVGSAEGEVQLSHEHTEFQWLPFSELKELPDLDSYLKKLIDQGQVSEATLQR
jgi:8-oxo-dGTP diphosphatase